MNVFVNTGNLHISHLSERSLIIRDLSHFALNNLLFKFKIDRQESLISSVDYFFPIIDVPINFIRIFIPNDTQILIMKNAVLLFILSCLFFGCKKDSEACLKIKEAEELIMFEKPDSAFVLLENITNPDVLNDKTFARFCLIHAGLSAQLGEDMPFVPQMERANDYYEKHGSPEEKMNSLLYLGMAYEEETDYEWAMKSYLSAVDLAEKEKNYQLVGKLYNKMAKLHDFDDNYEEAKQCYLLSGEYYLKGKDSVNYIYSIRDIGWIHLLKEEYDEALEYHQKAYRLALPLSDSLVLSSLTNRLGINYKEMGNYVLAEKFLFQSIAYDEAGSAPTYL